jgi:ABC-type lipoprotein export system ATPase subunit
MEALEDLAAEQLTEAQAAFELARLAENISDHDVRYWEDDAPSVSDADYDALKQRNAEIEARFPHLVREDSPSLKAELLNGYSSAKAGLDVPAAGIPTTQVAKAAQAPSQIPYQVDGWPPPPEPKIARARRWTPVEAVTIENFKAINKVKITLGAVTILVGPNGSGKSSALQAIHWAARCASYIAPKNGKEMIAFERIDYLPSSEPLKTAYRGELKAGSSTSPTEVSFQHEPATDEKQGPVAAVKLWAARNRGGITAHIEGGTAVSPYKQRASFITAYIPGLAGLAERETILAQPSLRRQAASGDAGGVLRNILLGLTVLRAGEAISDAQKRLERLNQLIQEVHPGISIRVAYDEREDFNISAGYTDAGLGGGYRSLETAATGVLQVIQIFAYLVSFRPKLLLIDEPDAHLHPDKQERLIEALEKAAPEFETQIILTTHSPNIAKAASSKAKLVWMSEGQIKTENDETIRRLMGWGGLDKHALFFVEDEDDAGIRALLRQWPDLARRIAVCRCFGVDNLPKDTLLRGLLKDGQLGLRALIHRDRDFMNDTEVERWIGLYKTDGVRLWVTSGCDVEAYFCAPAYLAALYGVDEEEAEIWRQQAVAKVNGARDTFFAKRKVILRVVWPDGGGDDSAKLWGAAGQSKDTVLGKDLWKALKPIIKQHGHDDKLLHAFTIPSGFEIAPDLKAALVGITA